MSPLELDNDSLTQLIGLIDLTTLSDTDTDQSVRTLSEKAVTPHGAVACVCVFQRFVPVVKNTLGNSQVKIATVANFPAGNDDINATTADIARSISLGANEIDVVLPWHRFLAGDDDFVSEFIQACKATCGEKIPLKVILETGALITAESIRLASILAINAGANFIKTSTGKISIGATLNAAESMLLAIRDTNPDVGFKASGGVRTIQDANAYRQLASDIMGPQWVDASHFRLGSSNLLTEILSEFNADHSA